MGVAPEFMAYHWHGDIFDLPHGAVSLASSTLTAHQAFRAGRAWGLLFHAEVSRTIVEGMVGAFGDELARHGTDGTAILRESERHLPALEPIGRQVFERWASLLASP
jgi:GMP synthase (glutamine-hydrolysing)